MRQGHIVCVPGSSLTIVLGHLGCYVSLKLFMCEPYPVKACLCDSTTTDPKE